LAPELTGGAGRGDLTAQVAAANRRPAGQSDGSVRFQRDCCRRSASPAAVAELGRWRGAHCSPAPRETTRRTVRPQRKRHDPEGEQTVLEINAIPESRDLTPMFDSECARSCLWRLPSPFMGDARFSAAHAGRRRTRWPHPKPAERTWPAPAPPQRQYCRCCPRAGVDPTGRVLMPT
jgi:hypothetical protein